MRLRHWFLPETPDVLGLVRRQVALTTEAMDAFAEWAGGDASAELTVRDAEQRGDVAKRELFRALHVAFVTPIEPEDAFALSRGLDRMLDHARDLISESQAMACPPDTRIVEMATLLGEAMRHIDEAIARLTPNRGDAIEAADAAIRSERRLAHAYYRGMAALLDVEDRSERIARRELYRRCAQIGETVVDVAERVIYAVMKQS